MYKLTMKNGTMFFLTIDDVLAFIKKKGNKLFTDGSYVKVKFYKEFCEDYVLEDLKK